MTIPRVNPAGWTAGQVITPTQTNSLDTNVTYAVDSRGGPNTPVANMEITGPFGVELQGTLRLKYQQRTVERVQQLMSYHKTTPARWQDVDECARNIAAADSANFRLKNLPNGAKLDQITLYYIGAGGHPDPVNGGAGLAMPRFRLWRRPKNSQTPIAVAAEVSDTTVIKATYEAPHYWSSSGISHAIDTTLNYYYVVYFTEAGGNYQANADVLGVTTQCTVTEQSEY